jgi:hypothetical protein
MYEKEPSPKQGSKNQRINRINKIAKKETIVMPAIPNNLFRSGDIK